MSSVSGWANSARQNTDDKPNKQINYFNWTVWTKTVNKLTVYVGLSLDHITQTNKQDGHDDCLSRRVKDTMDVYSVVYVVF